MWSTEGECPNGAGFHGGGVVRERFGVASGGAGFVAGSGWCSRASEWV